ncbi:MAG: hypothetical protein K8R77_06095 [Anaerolineaceae bacterium]|nr:hypothetical protein [Anaerolineaceae bacterium]
MANENGLPVEITGDTRIQIEALVDHLQNTEPEVIQLAISELYQAELREKLTTLIPRENDQYDVQSGGTTIATVCSGALKYVPDEMMNRLLSCGEHAGFSMIVLSAAKAGAAITTYNK